MSERMSKEEREQRAADANEVLEEERWRHEPGAMGVAYDLALGVERLLQDAYAADSRIAELEAENEELRAEVEKGYMLVRSRDNKIAKKMSQIKEIANRRIEPYTDQIRQQGQVIEGLKAARAEDADKIPKLQSEVERLQDENANLQDQITDYEEELMNRDAND